MEWSSIKMAYVEAVRMSAAGTGHEHIAGVRWRNPSDQNTGDSTTAVMVKWSDDGEWQRSRATPEIPWSGPLKEPRSTFGATVAYL